MYRKSTFIALFVCLMATISPVAQAYHWWDYQAEWIGGGDSNWHTPANWGGTVGPDGPDVNNVVSYWGNRPDAVITGDITHPLFVGVPLWDPSGWGPQDAILNVGPEAGNVNFGWALQLAAWTNFDSRLGGTTPVNRGIVNQYDGTVSTISTPGSVDTGLTEPLVVGGNTAYGLNIGGGASTYAPAYGVYNLYGGLATFPRIRLFFGEINLYGGTMEATDGNFVFSQNQLETKINVSGGKLKIFGDYMTVDANSPTKPNFPALIAAGRIACLRNGTLGTPVYNTTGPDAGYTTITSTGNDFNVAWGPSPAHNATNVHYRFEDVNVGVTLTWSPGDGNVQAHDVYFGTSSAALVYKGTLWDANGDPRTRLMDDANFPSGFRINTSYYWRVDEEVNNVNEAGVSTWTTKTGKVWTFKTHDGIAYNPKPSYNAQALSEPLTLSWTKGDFAAQHRIYFNTVAGFNPLFPRPTDSRYRGQQTGTSYPLTSLAGAFTLVPGNTYYWCIDEVASDGTTLWKGPEWKFTAAAYVNIDDFQDYNTMIDVNANWLTDYTTCPIEGMGELTDIGADLAFIYDASGKYMQMTYTNLVNRYFSETKRNYGTGTSFTGSPVLSPALAAVAVTYRGFLGNAANPDYDRMYMALEDTAGNVGVVYNPDPNAQLILAWTQWFVGLNEFTGVNTSAVKNFYVGMGQRCNYYMSGGGDGNVMFDNIRLYAQTCNPSFADTHGLNADLDNDCDVDVNDLDYFANDWLWRAIPQHTITGITAPHKAPVLWYKFNETYGTIAADSGAGDHDANVLNTGDVVWEPTGGRNGLGCLNLNTLINSNTHVEIPLSGLDFLSDSAHYNNTGNGGSLSFSMWINADPIVGDSMTNNWAGLITAYDNVNDSYVERMTFAAPPSWQNPNVWFSQSPNGEGGAGVATAYGPRVAFNNFGGRWNHLAAVKTEPNTLTVYCNGSVMVTTSSADVEAAPLIKLPIVSLRLGMRGMQWANWGKWSGKIQDFQVFDYALDANEVGYLATDGTGVVPLLPILTPANFKTSGDENTEAVDLKDLSIMCDQWHKMVLWP